MRPADERLIDSVRAAVDSFPDDPGVVEEIARLRSDVSSLERIEPHVHRVEIELAREIEAHLLDRATRRRRPPEADDLARMTVVSRAVAAALFSAIDLWMAGPADDLSELSRLTDVALDTVEPVTR